MKKTVIIDFDGTLADSFPEVLAFLESQTGKPVNYKKRRNLRGLSMKDLALAVGVPRRRLPLVFFRGRAQLHHAMELVPLFDGMREVLDSLRAVEGVELYIVSSNSHRNIIRFIHKHNLRGYFKRVYGNAGWFGKGRSLNHLVRRNRWQPAQTLYIGDEVRDIVGAHNAGIQSIAVTWGFGSPEELNVHGALALVSSPAELQRELSAWINAL